MVAGGSMVDANGYTTRVWMALKAICAVQSELSDPPVLLTIESIRNIASKGKFESVRANAERLGIKLVVVPVLPKKLPSATKANYYIGAWAIQRAVEKYGIDVVHAQSHFAAGAAAKALRSDGSVKLVFDVHGVDIEERVGDGRIDENSHLHLYLQSMQALAVDRCAYAFSVTDALAEHLNISPQRRRIVPCVASLTLPSKSLEDVRKEAREKLGVADEKVLLYLGGASAWQQPEFIVDTFRCLQDINSNVVFLIITGDVQAFEKLASERGIPVDSRRILSLPHNEVARIACAADAGLLLREDTIVNRVASPTKFAEYLAVGVPVVITDVLKDFAGIVDERKVGCVLPAVVSARRAAKEIDDYFRAETVGGELRERCRRTYREALSFESILPVYREVYG